MFSKKKAQGEFAEYKEELGSSKLDVKKGAIKKIIGALTVGKDMSSLFVDVVNCIQTEDMEMKKLVYLYVISYADKKPDLAILAVSTFTKDAGSENPILRALAIRTMGCIRVEQIAEYLCEPLRKAMEDEDPYVRKTAAVAVAKLYDITPEVVEEQGFIDSLKELISDSNPTVVSNAIAALSEIQENSPNDVLTIDIRTLQKLLAALDECIEWGQIYILDALVAYSPRTAREAETIVDRVAPRLQAGNSAIVLSATKVILKMMDSIENEDTLKSISRKLAPPLVSLLSSDKNEIQYIALRNINLIVQKRPQILQNEIKVFFCKYNDPIFVKMEKLDILVKLAKHRNIDQLLSEFKTYATEVDVDVVRCSVRCIGACAIKIEKVADRCVKALLSLVETKVHVVVQESIIVIRDIFRRYPNKYESIIANLCENLDTLDEPEAKAAMIWIIGEYSDRIDNADELLEMFMDNFDDEGSNVQLQILTAVVKLFLMKPEDTQAMVTQLLDMVTKEADNPDLRDRGYVYWRLLSKDPEIARSVVFAERPVIGEDIGTYDAELLDTLLLNVGTLAAVYHKPPETFIKRLDIHEKRLAGEEEGEEEEDEDEEQEEEEEEEDEDEEQEEEEEEEEEDEEEDEDEEDGKASAALPQICSQSGLVVKGSFSREDGQTYFNMQFVNKSGQDLSQFAIQFNKNTFGLKPDEASFKCKVASGGKGSYDLPVSAVPAQVKPGAPSNEVQIAMKTQAGVLNMTAAIPITSIFGEKGQMPAAALGKLWQSSPDSAGSRKVMPVGKPSKDGITKKLQQHNIFFSTELNGAMYYSAKTVTNQPFALEVRVKGNQAQIIIKSAALNLSNLLNEELQSILA